MITIAWGLDVSRAFVDCVRDISDDFGWGAEGPSNLMSCIAFETGRTFAPDVMNKAGSGAVGLIQFMPETARELGTTTSELAAMTPYQQLAYVKRYMRPYARRVRDLADLYMAILLPRYVGAPDDAVLFADGVAYRQNSGLDSNHDGKVTKAEAAARVGAVKREGLTPAHVLALL